MSKGLFSLRVDRKLWLEFAFQVKKEQKRIAEVIEPMLEKYLRRKKKKESA